MRNNKFLSFIQFNMILLILVIFVLTVIASLDVLNIIDVPEQYSITRFLTTTKEVSVKDYANTVTDDKDYELPNKPVEKDENTEAQLPDNLQEMYNQSHNGNSVTDTKNDNNEVEKYYYLQLNEYGKIIYDKMYDNKEKLKTGTYNIRFDTEFNELLHREDGSAILNNAFQTAIYALVYDKPELFYIDVSKMCMYTEIETFIIKKTYRVYIGPDEGKTYFADGFNSKEEVENAVKQVENAARDIILSLAGTEYLKIKRIHNYLVDIVEYDTTISKPNIYDVYGALVNEVTVCEGYAKAFKYILDNVGIQSVFVSGIGKNSKGETENHAWNYVNLDGNWYAVDVTWDDPILIGGGRLSDEYKYKYFLKGSNSFLKDHYENGNIVEGVKFNYPILSQNNY